MDTKKIKNNFGWKVNYNIDRGVEKILKKIILNIIKIVKSVKIFSPTHQQYGFLLYCKYVFNYDDVSFENDINKSSNYLENNIIDIKFLESFSKSKINNKLNYTIFFWTGEKQYFENLKLKNFLKKILKKNLNFFFVGNATQIKGIKFAKSNKIEKKLKF